MTTLCANPLIRQVFPNPNPEQKILIDPHCLALTDEQRQSFH